MIEAIERMWRRLRQLVALARLTASDDRGPVQVLQVQVDALTVQDDVPRMGEYGLASRPPAGTDAVMLSLAGNATNAVIVATNHQQSRPRDLKPGEVMLHDDRGQRVFLSAAGIRVVGTSLPIEVTTTGPLKIKAGSVEIEAATIKFKGASEFEGTVKANGLSIDETHRHTGGTIAGKTGGVTP